MTIDPTDCDEHCNSTIIVTWKNNSAKKRKFKPAIFVNDIKIELDIEVSLSKNQTTTQIFNLNNLIEGIYRICPYPN